ncbi:GD15369, partial [Drosophila simulans]
LINSPYYPALYPVGTSCRYAVEAPKDHVLQFKCELQLRTLSTDLKCRTEVFHFNSEGDEVLTSSEYFCGSGKFERKSFLNRAVISYISSGPPGHGGGRFSCLVEAFQPTCSCGWSRIPRIASPTNEEAVLHEFPPMAGVLTKKHGKVFCGAAIIHHHYLLSAAHCFQGPETNSAAKLRVVVGEHDLASSFETFATRRYDLDALILHDDFSQASGQPKNDIAMLKTRTAIVWSQHVGPACLPLQPAEDGRKLPLAGQQVVAAGWGTTSYGGPQTHRLLKATLDVIDGRRCRQALSSAGGVPPHTFCTYTPGRDTCQYDSGGALYERINGRLVAVGIVSFGQACAAQQPSVNTRVASFIKWIRTKSPEVAYCPGRT